MIGRHREKRLDLHFEIYKQQQSVNLGVSSTLVRDLDLFVSLSFFHSIPDVLSGT